MGEEQTIASIDTGSGDSGQVDTSGDTNLTGDVSVGGELQATPTWYSEAGFTDEEVGYIQNKGWDSADKVLKSYVNLEKLKGASAEELIKMPTDDASRNDMYSRLGRPEEADQYVLTDGEADPEMSDSETKWLKEAMHKAGLSSSGAKEFYDGLIEHSREGAKASDEALAQEKESEMMELRKEYGTKFDERIELANRALKSAGISPDQLDSLNASLGYSATIKLFSDIGQRQQGDVGITDSTNSDFGKTVQQYKADKDKLMKDLMNDKSRNDLYLTGSGKDWEMKKFLINKIREASGA